MDRVKAKTLSNEALEVLNKHFGDRVKVTLGNSKYDDYSLTSPFTFLEPNADGKIVSKEEKDYKAYASMFGLFNVPFGTKFEVQGSTYEVCGLKPKSTKYPVLGKALNTGKTYKFTAESVRRALGDY